MSWLSQNTSRRLPSIKIIADLHLNLGLNYRALGVYDQALAEFTLANTLNPSDPLPDLNSSRVYATIGRFEQALQSAESAVKTDPGDVLLHGNWGVMYYRNNKFPEAVQELAYVIKGGTLEDGTVLAAKDITDFDQGA